MPLTSHPRFLVLTLSVILAVASLAAADDREWTPGGKPCHRTVGEECPEGGGIVIVGTGAYTLGLHGDFPAAPDALHIKRCRSGGSDMDYTDGITLGLGVSGGCGCEVQFTSLAACPSSACAYPTDATSVRCYDDPCWPNGLSVSAADFGPDFVNVQFAVEYYAVLDTDERGSIELYTGTTVDPLRWSVSDSDGRLGRVEGSRYLYVGDYNLQLSIYYQECGGDGNAWQGGETEAWTLSVKVICDHGGQDCHPEVRLSPYLG